MWDQEEALCIEVEDQGVGISEENLKLLFNKYAQVGKKKNLQQGTGLGLSITKGLVELMGGVITMASAEGVGISVNITLPFKSAECIEPGNSATSMDSLPENLKALIVEDNKVNQAVITAMMNKLDIEYDVIEEGEYALPLLLEGEYDLVLMDINLPGISGVEATRLIKKEGIVTPIIALTADVFRTNKEKSLFDGFLTKPVQLAALSIEIKRAINTHN